MQEETILNRTLDKTQLKSQDQRTEFPKKTTFFFQNHLSVYYGCIFTGQLHSNQKPNTQDKKQNLVDKP